MQDKVSQRTGMLMQLGKKADLDGTQSTEHVTEKAYQPEAPPPKGAQEHATLYPQRAARVRNLEPFGTPERMAGPGSSRPLLPLIHRGRVAGRRPLYDGSDGFHAGEPNDHNIMRDAIHPGMRSSVRLASYNVSPPPLFAHAIGALEAGQRDLPMAGKGVLRGPAHRSPESGYRFQGAGDVMPSSIKKKFFEPPYPRSYK